jgi:glutathione S-transferase
LEVADMLTLYFAPGASSMAPHIALHEAGLAFVDRPISFVRKQHRSPEFLAINAEGKVPALRLDTGAVLTEVAAILYWIARAAPHTRLWPADDLDAEAETLSWMSFIASTLHPARGRGLDHAQTVYAIADQRLGTRDWAVGRYSIADIHLFRLYWRLRSSLNLDPALFPSLEAHYARMMVRDAVIRTIWIERAIGYELPK